jgi:hypothetical protein
VLSRVVYKKQRGRRLATALAALVLVSGTLVATNAVLAVNNTGAFELDGDATATNASGAPDDADRVCYQDAINAGLTAAQATARCTATSGTNGASAVQWIDSSSELTIFTGGGSKDPQNPGTDWLWKPKDTVPDKDTIEHSFAARYSKTPDATNCPSTGTTCEVIFFGVDRFDNSGDAQLGFWFFKNAISLTNTSSQGGFKFSGNHANGDLLLISQFSNGGTTSTIEAHFWDDTCKKAANNNPQPGQCSAQNLKLQAKSTNAKCTTSASTAPFCGIVNPTNGTVAPWPYTDKTGNHSYLQGEYYEAGVNLSSLGIGDECFPSFLAESRSSTSTTATLKDFVLGNFQNCSATAVTAPSSLSVSPGTPVTDHIFVIGAGTANPPFPSSPPNVVFSICGPIATGTCTGIDAAHTAAAFGATKALTPTAVQGKSEATSDQVNTAGSPLAPGRYCFVGSWAGDTNYPAGAADNGDGECFTVSDTTTTTSEQTWLPNDSATITSAGGTALNGTLSFKLYSSADCTGTVLFENDTDTGTAGIQPITLTNAASPATRSTSNTSVSVTTSTTVSWLSTFTSSDAGVGGSSHCEKTVLTITN